MHQTNLEVLTMTELLFRKKRFVEQQHGSKLILRKQSYDRKNSNEYQFLTKQVQTKKKAVGGAGAKAESSSASSEEESSSDEERKAKGVEGLIEIEVRNLQVGHREAIFG